MPDSFAVRFATARDRRGPLAIGADPHGQVLGKWGLTDDADGLERFTDIVLSAAADTVGLIKPQSAFYERHGWRGIRALTRLAETARAEGLLVILDVKRGDVGSTNSAYAAAYLGDGAPIQADAITVHPYLGLAAMGEFVDRAHQSAACLLIVTRSSNPEGRAIQSATAAPGMTVDQRLLADIGALNARLAPGRLGPVGAVIGPGQVEPPCSSPPASAPRAAPPRTSRQRSPPAPTASFPPLPGPCWQRVPASPRCATPPPASTPSSAPGSGEHPASRASAPMRRTRRAEASHLAQTYDVPSPRRRGPGRRHPIRNRPGR
jgi:orotidine-5'-phosphate decarboxylase